MVSSPADLESLECCHGDSAGPGLGRGADPSGSGWCGGWSQGRAVGLGEMEAHDASSHLR
jgi:hypothetical protein